MSADRFDMTDREWKLLESVLPKGLPGPRRKNDRKVMDGIFLPLRTGTPWRDLPKDYGPPLHLPQSLQQMEQERALGENTC